MLGPGDVHVVPRASSTSPQAEPAPASLMFEPTGTLNTGSGPTGAAHITTTVGVDLT